MYEDNTRSVAGHAPRTSAGHDTGNRAGIDAGNRASLDTANRAGQDSAKGRTDPKFARESFTMRRMEPWQIMALAVAAAIVIGLVVFYI